MCLQGHYQETKKVTTEWRKNIQNKDTKNFYISTNEPKLTQLKYIVSKGDKEMANKKYEKVLNIRHQENVNWNHNTSHQLEQQKPEDKQ